MMNMQTTTLRDADGHVLIERLEIARTFRQRLRGLLGHKSLPSGHGLLLLPCKSIHTFGMRFNIDLVFLDKDFRIIKVERSVKPCRFAFASPKTKAVVEISSGWLPDDKLESGTMCVVE